MVVATEAGTGKSVFTLGLFDQFERHGARTRYFKPVGLFSDNQKFDPDVVFFHKALKMQTPIEDMVAVSQKDVQDAIQAGRYDEILDRILEHHAKLAKDCDVLLLEGLDSMRAFPALDSDINLDIAKNIDASVLMVSTAKDISVDEVYSHITLARNQLTERGAEVFGVVVNRADPKRHNEYSDTLRMSLRDAGIKLFGVMPELQELQAPRLSDVAKTLDARVIIGDDKLSGRIGKVLVTAMGLENALHYFEDNALIIAPGDREEILLAAAASFSSDNMPRPSGVVLTGGFEPRRKVLQLTRSLSGNKMPVMRVATPTYETAIAISDLKPGLEEGQEDKALVIRDAIDEYIDVDGLLSHHFTASKRVTTPKRFLRGLKDQARSNKQTIVLPEGDVDRILKATHVLRHHDIMNVILIGKQDEIRKQAAQLDVVLDEGVEIVDPRKDPAFEDYVKTLLELRKHKGLPEDVARDLMADRTYFGTMMVYKNRAQGMVSGSTTTTQATLRPAFEFIKTKPGIKNVSSVFFMCLPDRVLVYGDCAVIPNPTTEQLADIAIASAETASAFGLEARVAMLSYSTGASGKGTDVESVRDATEIVKKLKPNLDIEGPIQYDAAVDINVAKTKLPDSKVAGRATVFVFPDLNTGNNTYKAVQRSANAIAVGPILQGLKKPVNDLSRGATIIDIVNTAVVTAIQAQQN